MSWMEFETQDHYNPQNTLKGEVNKYTKGSLRRSKMGRMAFRFLERLK